MTPAERIQQLAAQRAGGIIPRRAARKPKPRITTNTTNGKGCVARPIDPLADRSLPESWRRIADDWQHRERRQTVLECELRVAAWAIARCLGANWHYEQPRPDNRSRFAIVHQHGHGVELMRVWNNSERFRITPLKRFRTDDGLPSEITVAASRSFPSIAADIQRRLIDAGLKQAHDDAVNADQKRRGELATRFAAVEAVAKAAGGHITAPHRWKNAGYPEISVPGGVIRLGYGFNGDSIEFDFRTTPALAVELAPELKALAASTE